MADPTYDKFLPEGIPGWQMPFWESLRGHDVHVQRCDDCGRFRYIPKELCPSCLSERATWTRIDGHGTVYTYTIVHRAPTPAYQADVPYVLAHVTMDERFRMISRLRVEPAEATIGMRVSVGYDDVTPDWTLFVFDPA